MTETPKKKFNATEMMSKVTSGLLTAGKWALIIGVPMAVFALSAWWSLISALSSDVQVVPDLRGATVEEARFALSSRSMKAAISEETKYSQEIEKDSVLETDPPAGSEVKRGRTIQLILSSGFKRVLVPDLMNKSVREAQLLGEQNSFAVRTDDAVFSETIPVGHIVSQSPAPHTAFLTQTVDVLVSKGPRRKLVMVPDMVDRPLLPVLQKLRQKGMRVTVRRRGSNRDISNEEPFELRQMRIYRQNPMPGSFIDQMNPEEIILRVDWISQ